jgi:hypothetical protein
VSGTKGKHRRRMLENEVLRRVFGYKGKRIIEGWKYCKMRVS